MALSITSANYQEVIDSGKPVVIDFWAEWCGPCRMVAPIIDELAAEYEGKVIIGKCDVDENDALAVKSVTSRPLSSLKMERSLTNRLVLVLVTCSRIRLPNCCKSFIKWRMC